MGWGIRRRPQPGTEFSSRADAVATRGRDLLTTYRSASASKASAPVWENGC